MDAMGGYDSPAKGVWALKWVLIFLGLLPPALSSYPTYQICPPVELSCGRTAIHSVVAPFRTDDQPESCGMKSFVLFCHGEYPAIQINSAIYWVKEIDYQNKMLTLVNIDFVDTLCPSTFVSTTLDVRPFTPSFSVQQVTMRYNCSCQSDAGGFWTVPCQANASGSYAYLTAEPSTPHSYWGCNCRGAEIRIALLLSEFEHLPEKGRIELQSFMEALIHGFRVIWPDAYPESGWCDACNKSGGKCMFDDGGAAGQSCLCQGESYSPVCPSRGAASGGSLSESVIVGIALGIAGFFVSSCLLLYLFLHFRHSKFVCSDHDKETRKKLKQAKYIEAFLRRCGSLALKRYSYLELERITNSFSERIGKGGFATVFKGKLHNGRSVAVKVLNNPKSNGKEFVNEVLSIGWTYHVNIVGLLGYCSEGPSRALIYEFMPNGSLERFIFGDRRGTLGWEKLYVIAVGIAQGLEYLHRGCEMRILHFDIKPHNILLDEDFCPKISDFGLAKLCGMEKSDVFMSVARGTVGYIAPEVVNPSYGRASTKSDVYSYGMMVLEMVGGRKNIERHVDHTSEIYYPHWMYKHLDLNGNFRVRGTSTEEEEDISRRMIMVGLWCIQTNPSDRPSINRVVAMLEKRIELDMPPMPVLYSPPRKSEVSITTSML